MLIWSGFCSFLFLFYMGTGTVFSLDVPSCGYNKACNYKRCNANNIVESHMISFRPKMMH